MKQVIKTLQILIGMALALGSLGLAARALERGEPDAWLGVVLCAIFAIGFFVSIGKSSS